MTKEEAKTKWCPISFGRVAVESQRYEGRPDTCAASDCMWWVHEKAIWCHPDGREPTKEELHEHMTPEEAGLITVKFGHCGAIK